ncbi:MAG: MATE family efflux transporter [Eubacterium ventriosum]
MDMLNGPLLKKILFFATSTCDSSDILRQLFNSADVAVVGRFAGGKSLAAVGGNTPVISLLINLFVGLSVGANVVIGNYIGQGAKKEKVKESVHTVMAMAVICGVFLLIIGTVLAQTNSYGN